MTWLISFRRISASAFTVITNQILYFFFFLYRHLRAGWMAQELLLTFGNTIGELALIPGKSATFIVRVNGGMLI